MKKVIVIAGLLLALGACAQVSTTCGDIAHMPSAVAATLDAQDQHSALGVLWADTKSACVAGAPTPGVDQSWGGMVWGEVKALIPQLLPQLLPFIL